MSQRLWPLVADWFRANPRRSDTGDSETRVEYDIRAVDLYEMAAQQVSQSLAPQHHQEDFVASVRMLVNSSEDYYRSNSHPSNLRTMSAPSFNSETATFRVIAVYVGLTCRWMPEPTFQSNTITVCIIFITQPVPVRNCD